MILRANSDPASQGVTLRKASVNAALKFKLAVLEHRSLCLREPVFRTFFRVNFATIEVELQMSIKFLRKQRLDSRLSFGLELVKVGRVGEHEFRYNKS